MGTTFDEVFDIALWKFRDRDLLAFENEDRDSVLSRYLFAASAHALMITHDPAFDIDYANKVFKAELTNVQIEILATGMAYEWYSRKVLNSETIRNRLSNKDYSNHSPGTLLESMTKLRDQLKYELDIKLNEYSYAQGDVSTWTVR